MPTANSDPAFTAPGLRAAPVTELQVGFPPILPDRPAILVLGSMPGTFSLRANQYYGNPANCFWTIMGRLCGFEPASAYRQRVEALTRNRIALWDVLKSCERSGSSDAAISEERSTPNDIGALLRKHPDIGRVFFNGQKACRLFERQVMPDLDTLQKAKISKLPLPSTSPAYARMRPDRKSAVWQARLSKYLDV